MAGVPLLKITAFVAPLACDTATVAIVLGLRGVRPLRPAIIFAVFEGTMPLIGLALEQVIGAYYDRLATVLGGAVLLALAIHTLKETIEHEDESAATLSFGSIRTTALAGFAVSIDEAAVGFPMGTSRLPVPQTIAAIAAQAFLVTYAGMLVGSRLSAGAGRRAARFAGLIGSTIFAILGAYLIAESYLPGLPRF
jgi:putative Mn2+ efflux pump MntP